VARFGSGEISSRLLMPPPALSPDGRKFAFSRKSGTQREPIPPVVGGVVFLDRLKKKGPQPAGEDDQCKEK
jgi:hypothetical protein